MPIYDKTDYNINPYYDDWALNGQEYLRTLFRPGYAVQARELTQLQTTLQNQVGRFASHVFENGSRVYGPAGAVTRADWIRLDSVFDPSTLGVTGSITGYNPTGDINHLDFRDKIIYSVTGTAKARVLHTATGNTEDPFSILFIKYLDDSTFSPNEHLYTTGTSSRFDVTIKPSDGPTGYAHFDATSTSAGLTGLEASVISNDTSIYYVDGFFVNALPQTIVPERHITGERYFHNQTASIGFDIKKEFVSSKDDVSLLDPARGSSNYAAPGSDRLKYTLTLNSLNFDATAGSTGISKQDFFEILRVENDYLVKQQKYPVYSDLGDELARRTYDESGNYTVKPYGIVVKEHLLTGSNGGVYTEAQGGTGDALAIGMEAGKSYVFGYEHENLVTEYVKIDKARTDDHIRQYTDTNIGLSLGNYFRVAGGVSGKWGELPGGAVGFVEHGRLMTLYGPVFRYTINEPASLSRKFVPGEHVVHSSGISGTVVAWSPIYNTGGSVLTISTHLHTGGELPSGGAVTGQTSNANYYLTGTFESGLSGPAGTHEPVTGIGTCRVRQVGRYDDDENKLHIYDLQMRSAVPIEHVTGELGDLKYPVGAIRQLNYGNTGPATFLISGGVGAGTTGVTKLYEQNSSSLIYQIPFGNTLKQIDDIIYHVQQEVGENTQSDNSVQFVVSTADPNLTWYGDVSPSPLTDTDIKEHYILVNPANGQTYDLTSDAGVSGSITNSGQDITFSNLSVHGISSGTTLRLIGTLKVTDPGSYQKTKTVTAVSDYYITGENGVFTLPHADVIGITGLFMNTGDPLVKGEDVSTKFFFDGGQTDNWFDYGKLNLKKNAKFGDTNTDNIPSSGTITGFVSYTYYAHGGGDNGFFFANITGGGSYLSGYENIPTYTSKKQGKVFDLRDCLDFRPLRSSGGLTGTSSSWIPKAGQSGTIDYKHYLPRVDKIVLTRDKEFQAIRGIPKEDSPTPPDRDDSMTLYVAKIPAYTFDINDVNTRYVENKRYTMRDIGKIDKRVDRLEYYTTLSLLEKETDALSITDSNGTDIFKNGILVDPFKGHSVGDVTNPDYSCSIDFEKEELRPEFETRPITLVHDDSVGEAQITGSESGLFTLNYSEVKEIEQPMASTSISVNPFHTIEWQGDIRCTPQSDTWYDVSTKPIVQTNAEGENDAWVQKDNPFGTQWNDWELVWTGKENVPTEESIGWASTQPGKITREVFESGKVKTRRGIRTRNIPESIIKSLGNRTFNVSLVPYMRAVDIDATSRGLKPNTDIHIFFDGVKINDFTTPLTWDVGFANADAFVLPTDGTAEDTVLENTTGDRAGSTCKISVWNYGGDGGSQTSGTLVVKDIVGQFKVGDIIKNNGPAGIVDQTATITAFNFRTNSQGEFPFHTKLPAGTFRTGERQLRITDVSDNNVATATTAADITFAANGYVFNQGKGTRPVINKRPNVNTETILTNPIDRFNQTKTETDTIWRDPVAQSFLVDPVTNPNGMFVSSIDLWFAMRDGSLPVTVEIRPMVNGYPSSGEIIPMAVKTKRFEDVNVSTTPNPNSSSSYTRFDFDNPIFLSPGEYSFTVISNSGDYHIYTAEVGANRIDSEKNTDADPIANQPYAGVMFLSQNSSTWSADQTKDIMFRINRCDFVSSGDVQFKNKGYTTSPVADRHYVGVDVIKLLADYQEFSQTNATFKLHTSTNGNGIGSFSETSAMTIKPNTNVEMETTHRINEVYDGESSNATCKLRVGMSTSDSRVSPVIDAERLNLLAVENLINSNTITDPTNSNYNGELNPKAQMPGIISEGFPSNLTGGGGVCRYITRRVTLEEGFESDKMEVHLNTYLPQGSSIQAFIRSATPEYEGDFDDLGYVQLTQTSTNTYSDDLQDMKFETVTGDVSDSFNRFAIKLVLYSSDSAKVPRVKDLRAIALPG